MKIIDGHVRDIRFRTSLHMDGCDALNLGDYSATYAWLVTDTGLQGDGLTFTNGRGNEISIFDSIAVSGSLENRMCEYVDHLHEHFVDPCVVKNARDLAPRRPGYSITMKPESLEAYQFPAGEVRRELKTAAMA